MFYNYLEYLEFFLSLCWDWLLVGGLIITAYTEFYFNELWLIVIHRSGYAKEGSSWIEYYQGISFFASKIQ